MPQKDKIPLKYHAFIPFLFFMFYFALGLTTIELIQGSTEHSYLGMTAAYLVGIQLVIFIVKKNRRGTPFFGFPLLFWVGLVIASYLVGIATPLLDSLNIH